MVSRNKYIAAQKLFAERIHSDQSDEDLCPQQYRQRWLKSVRRNRVGRARRPMTQIPNLDGFRSVSRGESKRNLIKYCLPGAGDLSDPYEFTSTLALRHLQVLPRPDRQNFPCHHIGDVRSTSGR